MAQKVDALADGSLEKIEEEFSMDAVPQAVRDMLEAQIAGCEPTFTERSTREDGSLIAYAFEGENESDAAHVEIDEDGSGIVMNERSAA